MATRIDTSEVVLGRDKIERYEWKIKDRKGEFRYIDKRSLKIDHANYQRIISNSKKINEMANAWSWVACSAITVALRGAEYYVMDGQHRVIASLKRSDIQDLPCIVFRTDDIQHEARGFLDLNTLRKAVPAYAKFKALVTAGDDNAIFVDQILSKAGFVAKNSTSAGTVRCISCLFTHAKNNRETLLAIWPLLCRLTGSEVLHQIAVDALIYIENHMPGTQTISHGRWADRIEQVGLRPMLEAARSASAFKGKGGASVWAEGIINLLNKGLRYRLELEKRKETSDNRMIG